jgi:histidine kinase
MINHMRIFRRSLVSKLIFTVGLTLLLTISAWAYFNIKNQKTKLMDNILLGTDRLTNTIKLGTHYAMMLNSRDDINQIINNIGKNPEIKNIRIYNKAGQIKFSNWAAEIDQSTNIKAEACDICHRTEPPLVNLNLNQRTRIFTSAEGYRLLGIIDPIVNEPGCATDTCHVHPADKKILGALDVVVSLAATDKEILVAQKKIIGLAVIVFIVTSTIIFLFVLTFVNRPIRRLVEDTRYIAKGEYEKTVGIKQDDELGQLSSAISKMGGEIEEKQAELNRQRDEYQDLFERVPCYITVQDRNFRLLRYNTEFADKFNPEPGDHCFKAYKNLSAKCDNCPVEKMFADGRSHYSEESGTTKDGETTHWIVRTAPLRNGEGEIVAAMEMSLDITPRKQLEDRLEKSEKKYHAIFNNIPNPVFVLNMDDLTILDCNDSVPVVYGYQKADICGHSFLELFRASDRGTYAEKLKSATAIDQVIHLNQTGRTIFVDIRISPSEFQAQKVLLVTTSDITKRLEAEQQLIQASKMATLGEMATGVAHELNQPLSVIKTASSFFIRKIDQDEPIAPDVLVNMLGKIDHNVDRATKIINHMRQFARKSELDLSWVQVNEVMRSAFEIFSQQLKVRGIDVVWYIDKDLPKIMADADRLEQVFINLLLNARDAIEEKWSTSSFEPGDKQIILRSWREPAWVGVEVADTGGGLPEEVLEKVFEPFFTTKEVGKGTGLGLSISYGIVKDCGGQIDARNRRQGGAAFIIRFPLKESLDEKIDPAGR